MEKTILEEKKEAVDDTLWIQDLLSDGDTDDQICNALDSWCGLKDTRFIYMRKKGNHLEVGKAEIHCIE